MGPWPYQWYAHHPNHPAGATGVFRAATECGLTPFGSPVIGGQKPHKDLLRPSGHKNDGIRLLANPVYLAGYIEQVGTGTNDVIDRCVELGLRKPEFRQDEDFTAVLWRKEVSQDEAKVVSSNDPVNGPVNGPVNDPVKTLPLMAQKVYSIIRDNEGIRRPVILQKLGVSDSTIKRNVALLMEMKLIEHRGAAKTGGYYVKK